MSLLCTGIDHECTGTNQNQQTLILTDVANNAGRRQQDETSNPTYFSEQGNPLNVNSEPSNNGSNVIEQTYSFEDWLHVVLFAPLMYSNPSLSMSVTVQPITEHEHGSITVHVNLNTDTTTDDDYLDELNAFADMRFINTNPHDDLTDVNQTISDMFLQNSMFQYYFNDLSIHTTPFDFKHLIKYVAAPHPVALLQQDGDNSSHAQETCAVLQTQPDSVTGDRENCAVCLEMLWAPQSLGYKVVGNEHFDLRTESTISRVVQLPCNHLFHEKCVMKWLEEKQKCPYCRDCLRSRK